MIEFYRHRLVLNLNAPLLTLATAHILRSSSSVEGDCIIATSMDLYGCDFNIAPTLGA